MSYRIQRFNKLFMKEIDSIIHNDLKDPNISGFFTIVGVETTPDLENSKVLISVLDGDKIRIIEALTKASGFIRHNLGKKLHIKKIPKIKFILDETIEKASNINILLNKIKKELDE